MSQKSSLQELSARDLSLMAALFTDEDWRTRGRWVPCQASCVNTSSRMDKEELWLQNNSKTVNLTKPLGTGPFEVLATRATGEWRTNSIATNHHQAHMIPWLRPCVERPLDYCSCWVASGTVIGRKLGAHVSKQDMDWTLGPACAKILKEASGVCFRIRTYKRMLIIWKFIFM